MYITSMYLLYIERISFFAKLINIATLQVVYFGSLSWITKTLLTRHGITNKILLLDLYF